MIVSPMIKYPIVPMPQSARFASRSGCVLTFLAGSLLLRATSEGHPELGRYRIAGDVPSASGEQACGISKNRQRVGLRKSNRTSSKKVWSNRVVFILLILVRRMRKIKNGSNISPVKPEIRTWYAFEGPLGDVIHNKRFFFAWKEGCLMGTYNTLEEATASLAFRKTRETH